MEGKAESHMTSAVAFVEGGIQESCDDACSICLEDFCESDPSTVIFSLCVSLFLFHKYNCKQARFYLENIWSLFPPSGSFQVTTCKHEFHLQCILEWYAYVVVFLVSLSKFRFSFLGFIFLWGYVLCWLT